MSFQVMLDMYNVLFQLWSTTTTVRTRTPFEPRHSDHQGRRNPSALSHLYQYHRLLHSREALDLQAWQSTAF
jgi:hypothetical protein